MSRYTAPRAFPAEGARIALCTCTDCGAAIVLDEGDSVDPRSTHDEWHSRNTASRS